MYQLTTTDTIIRTADNACIPADPANSDYAAYLVWLDEGNMPDPYIPPPPVIPSVITMRQARLALLQAGLLNSVNTAMEHADQAAQIEWEFATEVHRAWPLVAAMQSGLGLTDDDLDALFTLGATL